MVFPSLAAAYAALFAGLYAALSAWVVAGRFKYRKLHGDDGGQGDFGRRVRAHANFIEYAPLILILVLLYEASGGPRGVVHALLGPLLVARLAHPFGMLAPANSPRQYACRGLGTLVTFIVLIAAALLLWLRVA